MLRFYLIKPYCIQKIYLLLIRIINIIQDIIVNQLQNFKIASQSVYTINICKINL